MRSIYQVLTLCLCLGLSTPAWSQAPATADQSSVDRAFLEKLVGSWRMEGRALSHMGGQWYRTGSSMEAELRLKDSAIVRSISAPSINMEAIDIISFDANTQKYSYMYLSSNQDKPYLFIGERTGADEITVFNEDRTSRTVIRFVDEDTMVAEDFQLDDAGESQLTREVFHYRVDP